MDFRNGIKDSGLYFNTYASSGNKRDEAFLQEFSDRLDTYTEGNPSDFKPNWMVVATWYKATSYYGRSNMDEVNYSNRMSYIQGITLSVSPSTDPDIPTTTCFQFSGHICYISL